MKGKRKTKTSPLSYTERTYRTLAGSGLVSSYVKMMETDLHIMAPVPVEDEALRAVIELRHQLEEHIRAQPLFLESLHPLPMDERAPRIVRKMLRAGKEAGVGPMAAVAGAIAEEVGHRLHALGINDLIVENGGDIFIARNTTCTVAILAGPSPLSKSVGVRLAPGMLPAGVCCSSGSVGHSLSLGVADAVVVVSDSTPLADAAATRIGNEVDGRRGCVDRALRLAGEIRGVRGVVIVLGTRLGAWGEIELVGLREK
ncbi:MAG: UPF0280 family protein [Desulfobulbaceae bacterium]